MATPTPTATAFFGIGAMRAGTSWLAQFLRQHSDCGLAPLKELHFFDVRYGFGPGLKVFRSHARHLERCSTKASRRILTVLKEIKRESQEAGDAEYGLGDSSGAEEGADADPSAMAAGTHLRLKALEEAGIDNLLQKIVGIAELLGVRSPADYASYLWRHAGASSAFGEISPSYALLPSPAFAEINALFPGAKFIFIMRDPVDRMWSQMRYSEAEATRRGKKCVDPNMAFANERRQPHLLARSNYHRTIEALERVIPGEQILYLFYEALTSIDTASQELRRVESFLGLQPVEIPRQMIEERRNASEFRQMSLENEAVAREMCAPVYEYVERRFGLPRQWRKPQRRTSGSSQ